MLDKFNERLLKETQLHFPNKKSVSGNGNKNAKICLVGEAPGNNEVLQGKPFVGSAGKNLDEFLEILELERSELYITNVVKIRPTKISPKTGKEINRPPNKEEVAFFKRFLYEEIEIINPKIIVTLGNFALKAFSGDNAQIGDCHAILTKYKTYNLFPLYHPASVIYNRALRETYLSDLHKLKSYL